MEADTHWHKHAREVAAGILAGTVDFARGCEELAALWEQTRADELWMFRTWCDPTLAVKRWRTEEVGASRLARMLLRILDDGWDAVAVDLTSALLEARDLLVHHPPGHLVSTYEEISAAYPEWLREADWGGSDWGRFSVEIRPPPPTPENFRYDPEGWRIGNAEDVGAMHIKVPLALCNEDWGDTLAEEARARNLAVFRYQLPDMPIYTVDRRLASSLFPLYGPVVAEVGEQERFFLSDFMYDTM